MKILFLESFYGGSHKDFADGLLSRSRHRIDLESLPARFWKWRMRGAALHFAHRIPDPSGYDGLLATDLMSVSDLKSLWAGKCPPVLLYFHENQLSYPLPEGESMDYQFGFTDITSALAADRVLFNSRFHRESFLRDLPPFIRRMPEHKPLWVVEEIERKSGVLYPGCSFLHPGEKSGASSADVGGAEKGAAEASTPPLIIWNHRWEFDKDPEAFFAALDAAKSRGHAFRLALLGESFQAVPKAFEAARERYGGWIVRYGYVESKEEYVRWLRRGDVVISTAIQENFGFSVVEAIRYGCRPLLPHRLSYPELLPKRFHADCLYSNREELASKLCRLLAHPREKLCGSRLPVRTRSPGAGAELCEKRGELSRSMDRFAWENLIAAYDEELERLGAAKRPEPRT
jgi:glycosyltransferase involved in cell wall biosynthesis